MGGAGGCAFLSTVPRPRSWVAEPETAVPTGYPALRAIDPPVISLVHSYASSVAVLQKGAPISNIVILTYVCRTYNDSVTMHTALRSMG